MWFEMCALWGNCSLLCRMYERGTGVIVTTETSRTPRLSFQIRMCKRDIQHVMPSLSEHNFDVLCEYEPISSGNPLHLSAL